MYTRVVLAIAISATAATAELDPDRAYRGICILSSSVGKGVPHDEIHEFVASCNFDLVVVDFSWITGLWPSTDFAEVETLAAALKKKGVEVVALYRPRALQPSDADVHFAKDADGKTAPGKNHLCFAYEDSVAWGARWGSEILRRLPSIDKVALYNLWSRCACERCRDDGWRRHVEAFLVRCRAEWKLVRPGVRIGHVGIRDEFETKLDFLMPFVMVNRKEDGPPLDPAAKLEVAADVRSRHPKRAVLPFAKIHWGTATRNTTEDVVAVIGEAGRRKMGLLLWYHEALFHHPDGRYDGKALVEALGGDWTRLARYRSEARTVGSQNWAYFESKETGAAGPKLELSFANTRRTIPAERDTVLMSYRADIPHGALPRLSVSLNDTNRVLVAFELPKRVRSRGLKKAELALDLKNSKAAPISVPFDLAVHAVTEEWGESAATWNAAPAIEAEPAVTVRIEPVPQILRIDVTDLVKRWLARKVKNHGLLLKVAAPTTDPGPAASAPPPPPELTFPFEEKRIEKLPWPHQAPGLSQAEIEKLNREVWIINDFPLYQADGKGRRRYFHGGLDIVLENGTEIRAMKDGWVKSVRGSSIVIADEEGDEPCYAWSYAHLGDHRVKVGDFVRRGTVIGVIEFKGLAHIHLDRVFSAGSHWGDWHYICVPNGHFTYVDEDPPVIATPFHFFGNGSDVRVEPDDRGEIRLSGAVDIVVGMREAGRYAHGKGGFGDRLGVMRSDYEIKRVGGGKARTFRSFDFNVLKIRRGYSDRAYGTELTKVVYKHYSLLDPGRRGGDKVLSYCVITNCAGDEPPRELKVEDREHAWDTAEKDATGKRLYPDGKYRITVKATDFDGNTASESMTVTVANGG